MARPLIIEGGTPLVGNVKLSGSRLSVQNIIAAALFTTEDVVLENVAATPNLNSDIEMLRLLGIKAEWAGTNRLMINASNFSSSELPPSAKRSRLTLYLAAPLLFRFGKVSIPMPDYLTRGWLTINRWIDTWKSLGIETLEDGKQLHLRIAKLQGCHINFKVTTYRGTCNAILSSLAVPGETIITNASEEPEVDDLIRFCKVIGADVTRVEPRKIVVNGKHVFNGGYYEIQPDRNEAVALAVGALITNGNLTIQNVNKSHLTAFVNVLTKVGARYEFFGNELRVWRAGEQLAATNITTAPAPGFNSDWQGPVTLLLSKCTGESLVHDTIYTNRFRFVQELNRMGAKIQLLKPSEVHMTAVLSDDTYDYEKLGEPHTVARIQGMNRLRGTKINVTEDLNDATILLAAICAEGRTELNDYEFITNNYDQILEKLAKVGAILKP